MWKFQSIEATNICAFRSLCWSIPQHITTLIFGNNLDNQAQGSNGSGKSALIEAIAVALTGEPLRKVKSDEIINDNADEATIRATLVNDSNNCQMIINRLFSRNSAQVIQVIKQTGPYDTDTEEIKLSSVNEYNKYILNELGLSKDDIYSNFILSKHKFISFLASSDREKKELINRFSNGEMVDESIDALLSDIEPIEEQLNKAEKRISWFLGSINTLNDQIATQLNEQEYSKARREEKIATYKESIAECRKKIREKEAQITEIDSDWDSIEKVEKQVAQIIEESDELDTLYTALLSIWSTARALTALPDYQTFIAKTKRDIAELEKQQQSIVQNIESCESDIHRAKGRYDEAFRNLTTIQSNNAELRQQLKEQAEERKSEIADYEQEISSINSQIYANQRNISNIKAKLSGKIECPKCHHTWVMDSDVTVSDMENSLQQLESQKESLSDNLESATNKIEIAKKFIQQARAKYREIDDNEALKNQDVQGLRVTYNKLSSRMKLLQDESSALSERIANLSERIATSRHDLINAVYDIIDACINKCDNSTKQIETEIESQKGQIASYKEAIATIENTNPNEVINTLQKSLDEANKGLEEVTTERDSIKADLDRLKVQEARFIEFKTYLANSKIEALSQITNEFLEAIGSDIRIAFSGFTVLKSGKIRDKISISLLRDGVDCGSFAKFSAGEQVRVNLANILALQKLTNASCEDDKGLDLLIIDELLDCADEAGLSSMFDALNNLQITSLVVSHGNVAEGYPYKLIINKLNGVSTLNGENA